MDMRNRDVSIGKSTDVAILGAGLANLTVAYQLTKTNRELILIEKNCVVGGLAQTITHGEYRFDLGGHRFIAKDPVIDRFVKDILAGDYLVVARTSQILLNKKYFHYPLKPFSSVFGLGFTKSIKILVDYLYAQLKKTIWRKELVSLEDWVIQHFGKTMYGLYFRDYSEKVWGIQCNKIAKEWIAQRIQGLSLGGAIKSAFMKSNRRKYTTLTDEFIYPHLGIGKIAGQLLQEIKQANEVLLNTSVIKINHTHTKINSIVTKINNTQNIIEAEQFVSSIPLTVLVKSLSPCAPQSVIDAAEKLRFRDLVVVAIMINKERVTDQTWIYFPDKSIPFARIHEPTNWSAKMAPAGKTLLVAEYFCFRDGDIWSSSDEKLSNLTQKHLVGLDIIHASDVLSSKVIRIPNAYPLFEVGFYDQCEIIYQYLDRFDNLSITGRGGRFKYYNMDHAIASGMEVAQTLSSQYHQPIKTAEKHYIMSGNLR